MPGTLYVVATPLGNLSDLSPRAVATLRAVAIVAAEDTRRARTLLAHLDAHPQLVSFHAHSPHRAGARLLERLAAGRDVALVSDAGTPAISDPGAELVRTARAAGIAVVPIPGPTAVAAALAGSGLPADRFVFLGFPPRRGGERRRLLEAVAHSEWTVVLFEAANRLATLLGDLAAASGGERPAVVARELTKKFEEFREGTLAELAGYYREHPAKGEVTIVVSGYGKRPALRRDAPNGETGNVDATLPTERAKQLLAGGMSRRDAARALADETGMPRREAYRLVTSL